MPYKPKSDRIKQHKVNKANEGRLCKAAVVYLESQSSTGKKLSLRDMEDLFPGVKKSTLERYINKKGKTILEFNATKQKLTPTEEKVLVDFIIESASRGFPFNHRKVRRYANAIRQSRLGPDCEPLSHFWIFKFISRHHERLSTHWSKLLDMQRARYLNPEAVKSWFYILEKFIVKLGIDLQNIYGMDESGFPMGYMGKKRVIGERGTKTQHKQGGADRENVTAVVTICADGTSVRPLRIFKGKNIKESWTEGNDVNAFIATSEKGWTDADLGRQWLEHVFDAETKEKAGGKPRVLLLDGHSSHYTLEFIDYARANNIILLGYPAHCTHALQGLDVVCFAKMKEAWKKEITQFEETRLRKVLKGEFTRIWSRAYLTAFTKENILAAFRATRVHPFNRDVITEAQMKPSVTISVKGSFPLPQPSPVRAVMAVFNANPPTSTSPTTHIPASAAVNDENQWPAPSTPSRRRRDPEIDPSLYTPTKRMRALYSALGSTSSGSFLVSKAKLTSSTPILEPEVVEDVPPLPMPNWSLAINQPPDAKKTRQELHEENKLLREHLRRAEALSLAKDGIIEGQNATMIIQNIHLHRLNGAVYAKETEKTSNRTHVVNASKATVYTEDSIRNGIFEQEERKKAIAAPKKSKAESREARKQAKARLEEEWTNIKKQHEEAMKKWKLTCEKLGEEGLPKKHWPKAPVCPQKPKLPRIPEATVDEEDMEEDEEDEMGQD